MRSEIIETSRKPRANLGWTTTIASNRLCLTAGRCISKTLLQGLIVCALDFENEAHRSINLLAAAGARNGSLGMMTWTAHEMDRTQEKRLTRQQRAGVAMSGTDVRRQRGTGKEALDGIVVVEV